MAEIDNTNTETVCTVHFAYIYNTHPTNAQYITLMQQQLYINYLVTILFLTLVSV